MKRSFVKQEIEYQCQELTCQSTFPWTVSFCPFCGVKQTSIKVKVVSPVFSPPSVDKSTSCPIPMHEQVGNAVSGRHSVIAPKGEALPDPVRMEDAQKKFSLHIIDNIANSYCDSATFSVLLRYGKNNLGLDVKRVESILSLTLQGLSVVNEKALLDELAALLHVFTDTEKKLDKKSRVDALQSVCKPRSGLMRGVDPEIAEKYINDFCRANGVMQRSGIWGWKIL